MSELEEDSSRRKFIRVATVGASAACGLFPLAAGIPALLDPVQKSAGDENCSMVKSGFIGVIARRRYACKV